MPRYYFDFKHNGQLTVDEEGTEFPDGHSAIRDSVRAMGDIVKDNIRQGQVLNVTVSVADESHQVLGTDKVAFTSVGGDVGIVACSAKLDENVRSIAPFGETNAVSRLFRSVL